MWNRLAPGLAILLVSAGLAVGGCSSDDSSVDDGADNAITASAGFQFNKNHLLDDAVLTDSETITEAQIQRFLEKTPYGNASALATYQNDWGTPASSIIHDHAQVYGINPLALLVRIEMETGLISGGVDVAPEEANAVADWIRSAFNCGSGDGLDAQAECAARNMAATLAVLSAGEVAAGWQPRVPMQTLDGVRVTPDTLASVAIYVYTPWVGEIGGGEPGVGGASGYMALWDKYAKALGYKTSCAGSPWSCPADAGAARDAAIDVAVRPDAGDLDGSVPADGGGVTKKDPGTDVGEGSGHKTPAPSKTKETSTSTDKDAGAAAAPAPSKKKGCSAAGGSTQDASTFTLVLGLAALASRRRRRA